MLFFLNSYIAKVPLEFSSIFYCYLKVIKLASLADPLVDCAIGFASKLPGGSEKQRELLDTVKTVYESALQLVMATKDAGGNPKVLLFIYFASYFSENE